MRQTGRHYIPADHLYFRSSYSGYGQYLQTQKLRLLSLWNSFWWAKSVLWNFWGVVKFDRVDTEPEILDIKARSWLKHGLLIWIPWKKIPEKSRLKSGKWKYLYAATHFQHTGFWFIWENYWKNWNERAKRARKKFLEIQKEKKIEIRSVDTNTWKSAFLEAKIHIPLRADFARFYSDISACAGKDMENYLCYDWPTILGWLTVLFYDTTSSVHVLSFLPDVGKRYQVGTGLIDYWYQRAAEKWHKYISFDHLRDMKTAITQQGYTDFKMNFINVELELKESYFKLF